MERNQKWSYWTLQPDDGDTWPWLLALLLFGPHMWCIVSLAWIDAGEEDARRRRDEHFRRGPPALTEPAGRDRSRHPDGNGDRAIRPPPGI